MELKKTILFFLLIVFLLSAPNLAEEAAGKAEPASRSGRCRDVPSGTFHRLCFNDNNCNQVCIGEGYRNGGNCHGIRRRCICKQCN